MRVYFTTAFATRTRRLLRLRLAWTLTACARVCATRASRARITRCLTRAPRGVRIIDPRRTRTRGALPNALAR